MKDHVWTGEKKRRAISSKDLDMRLALNKKYQSKDFVAWLRKRLQIRTNERILDVGCGTGAQTYFMAEDVGNSGHITSFDISNESIQSLKENLPNNLKSRVSAYTLDMANMKEFLAENYKNNQYTLAQSSYALYYSPKRIEVLTEMQERTRDAGRVSIFTPCPPHGMVDFAAKHHPLSEPVLDSLHFGENILRNIFRKCFWEVEVHYFQSQLQIKSLEDFKSFYEATTYYDSENESNVINAANYEIKNKGGLNFDKCGILLIGSGLRKLATEC